MFLVLSRSFVINTMFSHEDVMLCNCKIFNLFNRLKYSTRIKFQLNLKFFVTIFFNFLENFPFFSCSLFFICIRKGSFSVELTSLNLAFYSFLAFYSPLNPPSSLPPLLVNCSCSIHFNCFVHARIHQDFAYDEF